MTWRCPNCLVFKGTGTSPTVCLQSCSSPRLSKTVSLGEGTYTTGVYSFLIFNGNTNAAAQSLSILYGAACTEVAENKVVVRPHGAMEMYCLKGVAANGYGVEDEPYPV